MSESNLVVLDEIPRPPKAKITKVPAGQVICMFHGGHGADPHTGAPAREDHPRLDELRDDLSRIKLGDRRLTLREQRLVHRVLGPAIEIGGATNNDVLVQKLRRVGYEPQARLELYGDHGKILRAWIGLRVTAVWAFEGQHGDLPSWLGLLCECLAQEALRPNEVVGLTPANYFTDWEKSAKVKY
jgi:hypothetical protein